MNPFKYRPEQGGADPDVVEMEWEDNWLSNFMAWTSQKWPFEPMCNESDYTSSRIAAYFFTDCPCCLWWRGVTIGYIIGGMVGLVIGFAMGLWW